MTKKLKTLAIFIFSIFLLIQSAFAGPGGKIASALFESFWGKVLMLCLVVILSPWIAYVLLKEHFAIKRTRNDLVFMAQRSPVFDWLKLFERAKDCFYRIHAGWENEDLSDASKWMTDWYWQNQQLVHLNKWKRDGLINICNVKKIVNMKPLMFSHSNYGDKHEGSTVAILIEANMQDYLQERTTKKIVEGSKKYKDVETIWVFTLVDSEWVVSDIEDADMSLVYAKMASSLPPIESTLESEFV